MKLKLIALLTFVLALVGFAPAQTTTTTTVKPVATSRNQVGAQSVSYQVTSTEFSFLYLRDGYDNYAALNVPVKTLAQGNKYSLSLNGIGAFDPTDIKRQAYLGTGLDLRVNVLPNIAVDFVGGLKGLNVADNFKFQDGQRGFVFGVGLGVKF